MKSLFFLSFLTFGFFSSQGIEAQNVAADTLLYSEETHFKNVQQLTFGGDNAEAY